jgi:hypothetical protein
MAKAKKASGEVLVVGSKVKDYIRSQELRADGELVPAVSDKVREMIDAAIARTRANGRSTVRPADL